MVAIPNLSGYCDVARNRAWKIRIKIYALAFHLNMLVSQLMTVDRLMKSSVFRSKYIVS